MCLSLTSDTSTRKERKNGEMVTFLSYVIHKGLRHHIFFIILDTSNVILLDPRISFLIDN